MAEKFAEWRKLWRARGLVLDQFLPLAFAVPLPSDADLRRHVPATVTLPGSRSGRSLSGADREAAMDGLDFVTGYVAQMPAQIVTPDVKPLLLGGVWKKLRWERGRYRRQALRRLARIRAG